MKKLVIVLILITLLMSIACSKTTEPGSEPTSELALHEAYKAIETRLDGMATNSEAKRYLADFVDLTDGMWQINYVQEYKGYYVRIQQLRDSNPHTYYHKSYWSDVLWYLDSSGHISPDANARRIEADLLELSSGGYIEPNPDYDPELGLIIPSQIPSARIIS